MNTENLSTLKINKLTQEQYDRELEAGNIDPNALYLTPDTEIDLSSYATIEQLNNKVHESVEWKQLERRQLINLDTDRTVDIQILNDNLMNYNEFVFLVSLGDTNDVSEKKYSLFLDSTEIGQEYSYKAGRSGGGIYCATHFFIYKLSDEIVIVTSEQGCGLMFDISEGYAFDILGLYSQGEMGDGAEVIIIAR